MAKTSGSNQGSSIGQYTASTVPKAPSAPSAPSSSASSAAKSRAQTLRSWADSYGVKVDWNPDTEIVTLTSPNNTTVRFLANQGEQYGVGKMNAENYHLIENEGLLINALRLNSSSAKLTGSAPAAYVPDYQGTPDTDYRLDREADALMEKRAHTVGNLMSKKSDLADAYARKRGQYYTQYKQSEMAQDEYLAAKGLNGGYADAANTRLGTSYKSAVADLGLMESDDLKSVDSAISQAYQTAADALYSLETGYVAQLLKAAQKLEGFDYVSGVSAATTAAKNIIYR